MDESLPATPERRRPNKAPHRTAYSLRFGRKLPSLRLSATGEFGRWAISGKVLAGLRFKGRAKGRKKS
jgi:hypothetical protein